MGGRCIFSISSCQSLHAVGYPFDCPNIVCLILFPNINQTTKQNYPSLLEISKYPMENEPEVFLNTYSYTNLAYNVLSAYLITVAYAENFHWGGVGSGSYGGYLYLVCGVCDITI